MLVGGGAAGRHGRLGGHGGLLDRLKEKAGINILINKSILGALYVVVGDRHWTQVEVKSELS